MTRVEVSTDPTRLDTGMIHNFLSRRSYWAQGRSREMVQRTIDNSLCFGAYLEDRQVGFARAVTDRTVFAYIADVFVVEECRGHGVGKALMQAIVEHPELCRLQLMLLRTRDAHGLYAGFGFVALPDPAEMMSRYRLQT